jgi:hypothetical protein
LSSTASRSGVWASTGTAISKTAKIRGTFID